MAGVNRTSYGRRQIKNRLNGRGLLREERRKRGEKKCKAERKSKVYIYIYIRKWDEFLEWSMWAGFPCDRVWNFLFYFVFKAIIVYINNS